MRLYILLIYLVHSAIVEADGVELTSLYDDENNVPQAKTCLMERVYKMVGYVCAMLELKEIPQNLTSDLQALDVSMNRIRELNENSFSRYPNIKYLYLFDNLIIIIQANTFSQLTSLEAVDFSRNGLTTLPMELFSLPLLRNIRASDNPLVNFHKDLKEVSKPIMAPLQLISLSNCKLNIVPDFGILPELFTLNISSNDLLGITPQQLSPFCSVKTVDVNNTKIPPCPCQAMRQYFCRRLITTPNDMNCDTSADELANCPDVASSTIDSESYSDCTNLQEKRNEKRVE